MKKNAASDLVVAAIPDRSASPEVTEVSACLAASGNSPPSNGEANHEQESSILDISDDTQEKVFS